MNFYKPIYLTTTIHFDSSSILRLHEIKQNVLHRYYTQVKFAFCVFRFAIAEPLSGLLISLWSELCQEVFHGPNAESVFHVAAVRGVL